MTWEMSSLDCFWTRPSCIHRQFFKIPRITGKSIQKQDGSDLQKLELQPQDHLLEIGTGWGGFAIHAAQNYGCKVTTTTISQEQFQLATTRVKESGLQDRVEVLKEDYRNLNGQYDKLVSIEMIEAVGHQFLQGYFQKCSSLLKRTECCCFRRSRLMTGGTDKLVKQLISFSGISSQGVAYLP